MVRGKFFVLGIEKHGPGSSGTKVKLGAVSRGEKEDSENTYYHKYTPSGTIEMYIDNPPAEEFFQLGKIVYVDFHEATQG